jgi:CubicO group peptidase (beta-lactamase class C family)
LGHVLARRAGVSYEELIKTRICLPLGMKETQIALSGPLRTRFAQGHDVDGNPVSAWDLPTLAGAGALRSDVHDLLLFVAANVGVGPSNKTGTGSEPAARGAEKTGRREAPVPVLLPLARAIETTHVPRHEVAKPSLSMALGWHLNPKERIHWHNGQTGGCHSFVAFQKERKIGVVVLSNSATGTVDQLGNQLLRLLLGLPVEPLKLKKPVPLDPKALDQYVGKYEMLPGQVFTVTRQGDRLMVQLTGQPGFRVYPESQTEFFYRVVDARITFVRDADGKVNKLVLHQNGLDLPAYRGGMVKHLGQQVLKALGSAGKKTDATKDAKPQAPEKKPE